jgi:metallo-beta-lactamase family protein
MDIQFFGATHEVTGSCFLINVNGHRVLVECGLFQGRAVDEARNREPFPFDPTTIDAVILTHAHLDHSGRLPLLFKAGFNGFIYTHHASKDLCRIMLKDAGYINEKEAQWENKKRQRKHLPLVDPLYTMDDAKITMRRFKSMNYAVKRKILSGVTVRLQDAGHILGSAIVEVWLEEGGVQRKLVFSGDLGHYGAPILRDPEPVQEADLIVIECTYGDRSHRSWEATWAELAEVFSRTKHGRGNILIPCFAVGRTQELLYIFGQFFDQWKLAGWSVFLDSPMAIEATEVYSRHADLYDKEARKISRGRGDPFKLPNLKLSRTAEQSMQINRIADGAIIIAGSGMCNGGRIKHHLKHNIWRSDCQVIMVGFQAAGTLGRTLVDGAKAIRLWGETIRVAAQVHTIGGLSAHAGRDGLLGWYKQFNNRPPVVLVHGESEAMQSFASCLEDGIAPKVHMPGRGTKLDLVKL